MPTQSDFPVQSSSTSSPDTVPPSGADIAMSQSPTVNAQPSVPSETVDDITMPKHVPFHDQAPAVGAAHSSGPGPSPPQPHDTTEPSAIQRIDGLPRDRIPQGSPPSFRAGRAQGSAGGPVSRAWSGPFALLLAALACAAPDSRSAPPAEPEAPVPTEAPSPPTPVPPPSPRARIEDERNSIDVFKAVAPATVFVTQNQLVLDRYSMRATEVATGTGSGFVWDRQGHVVTNFHVVDGARTLTVTLHDQSTWPAVFVGGDPRKDVAVLKIEAPAESLAAVQLPGPGYELEVGQKTLAIGNPFGLDHTLTTGVVSALGREIVGYGNVTIKGMIQTDASINPGNSGGPLLDSAGRLIGMNTMIYSQAGQSAGIGFAVPFPIVERVVTQIVERGAVVQLDIGADLLDDRVARRNGIEGVAVLKVRPGSPAAKEGLRGLQVTPRGALLGDIVVAVDGAPVRSYDDWYNALDPHREGDRVTLTVVRDGARREVQLPLVALRE